LVNFYNIRQDAKMDNSITLIPFKSKNRKVPKEWIDYNGHMNVAYYTLAFDQAIDEFLESEVGIGPSFIKKQQQGSYALQSQYRYLAELILHDGFSITILVADFTLKRMHLILEMIDPQNQTIFATCETIMVNVDLKKRKSCEYPEFVQIKLKQLYHDSEDLRLSTTIGHPIGLRSKLNE
jgi:acyl-CoA thioester hydrolase